MNRQYIKVALLLLLLVLVKLEYAEKDQINTTLFLVYYMVLYNLVDNLNVRVLLVCCIIARSVMEAANYMSWVLIVFTFDVDLVPSHGISLLTLLGYSASQLYAARYRILIMHKFGGLTGIDVSHYFPTYADRFFIRFFKIETTIMCGFIYYYLYLAFSIPGTAIDVGANFVHQINYLVDFVLEFWDYWGLIVELLFISAVLEYMSNRYNKQIAI